MGSLECIAAQPWNPEPWWGRDRQTARSDPLLRAPSSFPAPQGSARLKHDSPHWQRAVELGRDVAALLGCTTWSGCVARHRNKAARWPCWRQPLVALPHSVQHATPQSPPAAAPCPHHHSTSAPRTARALQGRPRHDAGGHGGCAGGGQACGWHPHPARGGDHGAHGLLPGTKGVGGWGVARTGLPQPGRAGLRQDRCLSGGCHTHIDASPPDLPTPHPALQPGDNQVYCRFLSSRKVALVDAGVRMEEADRTGARMGHGMADSFCLAALPMHLTWASVHLEASQLAGASAHGRQPALPPRTHPPITHSPTLHLQPTSSCRAGWAPWTSCSKS